MTPSEDPQNPSICCLRVRFEGRVQGVGFRMFVLQQAQARGLDGFVRNRRDGGVEVVVKGATHSVEAMLVACCQGPRGSRVDFVKQLRETMSIPSGFTIDATV